MNKIYTMYLIRLDKMNSPDGLRLKFRESSGMWEENINNYSDLLVVPVVVIAKLVTVDINLIC